LPSTRVTIGVRIAKAREFWITKSVFNAFTSIISGNNGVAANLTEIAEGAKEVVICACGLNSREFHGARRKAIGVSTATTRCCTLPGTRVTVGVCIAKAKEFWTTKSVFDAFTSIIFGNGVAANLTEIAVGAKEVVICARGWNSREFLGACWRDNRTGFALSLHHAASFHHASAFHHAATFHHALFHHGFFFRCLQTALSFRSIVLQSHEEQLLREIPLDRSIEMDHPCHTTRTDNIDTHLRFQTADSVLGWFSLIGSCKHSKGEQHQQR
jgi:hypothetical protein